MPSFLGGHGWQPMAFEPKTGLVYLPAQETVAQRQARKQLPFFPHESVAKPGVEVRDIREDPNALAEIAAILSGAHVNKGMPALNAALEPEDMELLRQYLLKRARDPRARHPGLRETCCVPRSLPRRAQRPPLRAARAPCGAVPDACWRRRR